jgi:hypothetical protein
MPIRKGDEDKLADKVTETEQQKISKLPKADQRESKIIKHVKDPGWEGDN